MNDGEPSSGAESPAQAAAADRDEVITEPRGRRNAILSVIRKAERRLRLSVFRCTDFKVLDELAAALDRGVQVDLLLTQKAKGWQKKLRDLALYLESMGAELHRYSRKGVKYHAKYAVADDSLAAGMSLNLTNKCFERTCDFIVLTRDPAVISALQRLFDADCRPYDRPMPEMPARLIVSPELSRGRIAALFRGARRRISILDHKLQDTAMLGLLEARRRDGLRVEALQQPMVAGFESHGKLFIVDEETAVIGSIALSTPGLDKRREAAIALNDPVRVGELSRFFDGLSRAPAGTMPAVRQEEDEEEEE